MVAVLSGIDWRRAVSSFLARPVAENIRNVKYANGMLEIYRRFDGEAVSVKIDMDAIMETGELQIHKDDIALMILFLA